MTRLELVRSGGFAGLSLRDVDDPKKMSRCQAEALVYRHLPTAGLLGIVCYTEQLKLVIEQQLRARNLALPVYARTRWYF